MGIEIPDELAWVAKYILGAGDWPEGDETAMRRVADGWTAMANTLDTADDNAALALNAALTALSEGETHTAITTYRDKLLSGDEATFAAIRKWCEKQAELLEDGANDIEHTKLVIIATMIIAAVEIGAAIATAWTGVGAVAGVAARVAAQVAVRVAIKQLIARMLTRGAAKAAARLALRGAAFEALEEGGTDLGARLIQVANGDRSADKFGWTDLGLATFGGAVGGAAGGLLGGGTGALGDVASSQAGKLAGKVVGGTVTELGADLSAQVATAGVGAAFLGQEFKLDVGVDSFTSAGAGGVQSALESSGAGGTTTAPTVPDVGSGAPGSTAPAGTGTPSDTGNPSPAGTDNGGSTNGAPTTPAGTDTGSPTAPASTGDQGDGTTSPQNGAPATGDSSPTTPNSNGANGTPPSGGVTPSNTDGNGATPNAGDTAPTSTPNDTGSPESQPGDTTPSSPNNNGPNETPPVGDTTPLNPNSDGPNETPSSGDAPPSSSNNSASPTPTTNEAPQSINQIPEPPSTPPTGDTTPSPNSTTGSSLDLPSQDPSPPPSTPSDSNPTNSPSAQQNPTAVSTGDIGTTPTTPANPQPTTQAPTAPTTTPDSTPQQPTTSTPGATPTTPTTTDTSTATATTATTAPTQSGTPTPTTAVTPSPPPSTVPTSAPTPTINQTPTSAPSSPRPTTTPPATTKSPNIPPSETSTSTTPSTRPSNTLGTTPTPASTPVAHQPSSPAQQQALGTSPTPASSPYTHQPFGPNPTPNNTGRPPRSQARELRESLRNLPSQDGRTTAVDANRSPFVQRPPAYRIRRFHLGGNQWVAVATVRVHIPNAHSMSPSELRQAMESIQSTVDATFNDGSRLLSRDRFLVDVEFTTDPASADTTLDPSQPSSTANALRDHIGLFPAAPGQSLSPNDLREISNDIARANTPTRFSDPADSRVIDHRELADVEDPEHQVRVEEALRAGNSFVQGADPRTHPYGRLTNDGGRDVPGRGNNCLDCSLSALSSFFGIPRVSAPRWPDLMPNGEVDNTSGEWGGRARAAASLGSNWGSYSGMPIPDQYQALHNYIASMGPGSAALVGTMWHARDANGNKLYNADGSPVFRGGHATVIVYPPGASGPVWWDPQSGTTSDAPPPSLTNNSASLECIPIDANGGPPNGGTSTHPGTGQTFAGTSVRTEPGIQHPGGQTRLGVPANVDPAGASPVGNGSGQLRDQQTYGGDHGSLEHGDAGDRGGIRRDDGSGSPTPGLPGVSEAAPNSPDSDVRGPEHDRVPSTPDIPGEPGRPGDHPAGRDNQESDPSPSDGPSLSGRDIVGVHTEPEHGDLARGRNDRAVEGDATSASSLLPETGSSHEVRQAIGPASTDEPSRPRTPPTSDSNTPPSTQHSPRALENAEQSRSAREQLRASVTATGESTRIGNQNSGKTFQARRVADHFGQPLTLLRIAVHFSASTSVDPRAVNELTERAQLATDLAFNGGHQFVTGEWVMVDVVPVDNAADADMRVQVDDTGQPGTTHPNTDIAALTSQLREQLGLAPSTAGALSPSDLQQLSSEIDRATLAPPSLPPWLAPDAAQSSSARNTDIAVQTGETTTGTGTPAADYQAGPSPDSDGASVAGHDTSDQSLPDADYFQSNGLPVPTNDLVHPDMDSAELQRLQSLDSQLSAIARDHRSRTGAFPDPPPGVGRGNPAVDALLPQGWDPFHGLGRDAWMRSIAGPNGEPEWADGNLYPQGFSSPTDRHPAVLQPGEVIDRFGGPSGRFTSPAGVPYPQRALPPTNLDGESYHQYEVLRPLPVWRGGIAPQMGEPGLGSQHYLPVSAQALIDAGYLREVDPLPHAHASGSDVDAPTADGLEERGHPAASPTTHPFMDDRPGFSIMSATDRFYQDVQSVPPLAGHYDVIAHGRPDSVNMDSTGGGAMSARELANLIRHRPDYVPGTPVRLLSCNTGRLDGNFARSLAQALGTPVVAPDGYLYTAQGRLGIDVRLRQISRWQVPRLPDTCHRFHPDGRVEELDRSEWEG